MQWQIIPSLAKFQASTKLSDMPTHSMHQLCNEWTRGTRHADKSCRVYVLREVFFQKGTPTRLALPTPTFSRFSKSPDVSSLPHNMGNWFNGNSGATPPPSPLPRSWSLGVSYNSQSHMCRPPWLSFLGAGWSCCQGAVLWAGGSPSVLWAGDKLTCQLKKKTSQFASSDSHTF